MKNVAWMGALVAIVAASSQGATVQPQNQVELPIDAGTLPDDCRQFLQLASSTRSELLPWYQRPNSSRSPESRAASRPSSHRSSA